jgi:hypothetical protein
MDILRKIIVGLSWSVLPLLVVSFGILLSMWLTLSGPDHVKAALKEGGLYKTSATDLLSTISPTTPITSSGDIDLDNPTVSSALSKALPSNLVENQSDKAIDGVYSWIKGDSNKLSFALDFSGAKKNFATYLSTEAYTRVNALPTCPISSSLTLDLDPFTATCKPVGVTADMAAAKIYQEVEEGNLFNNSQLTASDITNDQGKDLSQQLSSAPNIYDKSKLSLILSGAFVIILAAAIIWFTVPKRQGAKRIAGLFLTVGICGAIFGIALGAFMDKFVNSFAHGSGEVQTALLKAIDLLLSDMQKWWLIYTIGLIVVGIAIRVVAYITRPTPPADSKTKSETSPTQLPTEQPDI